MIRFVLAIAFLFGIMWLVSRLGKAPPAKRKRFIKLLLLYGGVALLIFLIVSGKLHPLFAAIMALVPWVQRAIMLGGLWRSFKSWRAQAQPLGTGAHGVNAATGKKSTVRSAFLEMTLDHDSGTMDGAIITGQHQGSRLSQLGFEALLGLLSDYQQNDVQSAQLLQVYLQREHGAQWQSHLEENDDNSHADNAKPPPATMTLEQAYQVLGLQPGCDRDAISTAHKQLVQRFHPDRGGSAYLAGLINQARDQLLKHLEQSDEH